jgi:flap endonuclease-1
MGIEDLLKEIKKKHPEVVLKDVPLKVFKGTKLPIDVSIYGYKYMYVARCETIKYTNIDKENPKHSAMRSFWLEQYYKLGMAFVESDVVPVPVFDGPPFRLKDDTKETRAVEAKAREDKINDLRRSLQEEGNNEQLRSELRAELERAISVHTQDWKDLEEMFRAMGFPVLVGPYEAEAVCARLARAGLVSGVVTNDGDALAHSANIMIIDVKKQWKGGKPDHRCTCIILSEVLRVLELTKEAFIDFCILLGTDYNPRVRNHGWKKALDLIKEHGNLEAVLSVLEKKVDLKEHRLGNQEIRLEIRGYFTNPLPDSIPDHPLTVHYNGGLKECFETLFTGYNQNRMMAESFKAEAVLSEFNQKFARLQKFVPTSKESKKNV